MELKLNEREVKDILLDWAETNFPGEFNTLSLEARYGAFECVTFCLAPPLAEDAK